MNSEVDDTPRLLDPAKDAGLTYMKLDRCVRVLNSQNPATTDEDVWDNGFEIPCF